MIRNLLHPRGLLVGGGLFASLVLLAFGSGSIVLGVQGRQEVRDNLGREKIVGTQDSTIAGQLVDTGAEARAFADVMRKHTLDRTGGLTYAEMPRYMDVNGQPTNDVDLAARNAQGQPVENPLRQLWVTETALTTALNTAYFAEQVGTFVMVMGVALVLSGVGFGVLAVGALRHSLQATETAEARGRPIQQQATATR